MPLKIFLPDTNDNSSYPVLPTRIQAGFPSPAEDYLEGKLSLNELLIRNPSSTFFAHAEGDSMQGASINDGDLLIIDRSIIPAHGHIAVCHIDGEFTIKRINLKGGKVFLMPENPKYAPIPITEENNFTVWGIVMHVIKKLV